MTNNYDTKAAPESVAVACPDCGSLPGFLHENYCDVEQCPDCGHQRLSCICDTLRYPRIPWNGQWRGVAECIEFGWYAKFTDAGWVRCGPDDPDANPDLNRLLKEAKWDPSLVRFVRVDP